jgi:hypothetical protein
VTLLWDLAVGPGCVTVTICVCNHGGLPTRQFACEAESKSVRIYDAPESSLGAGLDQLEVLEYVMACAGHSSASLPWPLPMSRRRSTPPVAR